MGSRRRRRRSNEISRYNLNEYVRKRVEAIENNPFAFSYSTPTASYRGRYVEKVEDSYASLASYAYRGDSVVAACMRVRRDLFRQAKFCWREIDEAGPGKIFRTDELDLLDNPWPNGTTGELLARMITDTDLCGNSFIHHDGDRLRWLRPDWVSIVLSGDPQADPDIDVLGYVYTPGGLDPDKNGVAYSPDDICHWAPEQDPLAFYRGMSWVSKALEEVQGDRAATTHKVAFFRNGATLGPIVRVPAGTSMQQFKEFMAAAEEAHAGAHNAYKTMYLGGGADVTLAAADFRQLDLKSVQGGMETRIAAVAGVHPVLVGLSEGLAGSSLNSGNFAAARRATAEMTLYSLWQDACGALQAFFKVPDQAELWIRERDIPFLREEARDRAEIFKTQVLAIEAAMRAGFKPDPAVKATLEERLDLLIGNHTGLFSVQMQPPQLGMPGAPPLDVNGDGQPDEPGAPIDFGALRAGAWWFDPEDIERGVEAMFDGVELDDVLERSYNPEQARIPKGFEGGGRFRKLSDRLVALLNDWAKGEGDDDPLDEYSRDQLRRVAKELADKARADGDNERAARLTPRRGASSDEIKLALYKDVRAHVRGERDRKADEPKRQAKFTLQNGEFHDKDVAVYRLPGDKPALFYESDAGRRGGLVERFDDLDGLAAWADEHGETRLAEWARKEGGRKAPDADVRESALGSTRKTQGQLDAEHRAREERIAAQEKDPVDLRKRAMTARKRANQAVRDGRDGEAREQLATAAEFDRRANAIQPMTDDELAQYGRDLALYETDAGRRRLLADARKARTRGPEVAPASGRPTAVLSTEELSDIRAAVSDMENEGQRAAARRALRLAQDGDAEGFIAQARYNAKTLRADADKNPERFYRHNLREQAKVWDQLADKAEARSRKADADVPHPAEQAARVNALRAIATSNDDYALRKRRLDREIPDSKAELTALAEDGGWTRALKGKGDLRDRLVDVILDDPDGNNPRVPAPARTPQLRGTDFSERGDPGTEQDLHAYMVKAGDEVLIGGTWERVGKNWAYGGHRVIERPDGSLIDDTTLDTATVRVRIGADHLDVHPREQAARDRQARYDRQRAVAKPLAHTLAALDMEASDRALRNRIEGQAKAAGTPDEVRDRLLGAVREDEVENRIRAAYRDLASDRGGFISVTALRERLGDMPRAEVDDALRRMYRRGGTHLAPQDYGSMRTPDDDAAALSIGGRQNHLIQVDDPSPRHDRLREAVNDLEREHGLTRIGDTDQVVPFDGMAHESISPDVRKGQQVTVLRPGYYVQDDNGRRVVLESAQVQDQGPTSPLADEARKILTNASSTYELDALLSGRSKRQLRGIADHLGIEAGDNWTAERTRREIASRLMPGEHQRQSGRFDVSRLNDVLTEMAEPPVALDEAHVRGAQAGWPDVLGASPGRSSTASAAAREALHDYKSDAYFEDVNDSLASGRVGAREQEIADGVRDSMRPLDTDVVVWRGDRGLASRLPRGTYNRRGGMEGVEFDRGDFTSTSADEAAALGFATNDDGTIRGSQPTLMRIRVPAGTPAVAVDSVLERTGPEDISSYLDEQEILLGDGLRYRITRDYGVVRGVRRLDVEVVPSSPAPAKQAPGGASDLPDASDPEALRDVLDLRTVDQLKAMLRERGLPVSGRKRELVDRLVDAPNVAPAKTTRAKARGADNSAIVDALRGGGSEGEYIRALAVDPSLTLTKLRAIAADLGIDVPADMRAKTALQLHIASEAARKFGPGDGSLVGRMPTPDTSRVFDADAVAERIAGLEIPRGDVAAATDAVRPILAGITTQANLRKLATAFRIQLPGTYRKTAAGPSFFEPKKMTTAELREYLLGKLAEAKANPRYEWRSRQPEGDDLIRAEVDVEDLEDEDYDDEPDLEDMQAVAAMDAEVERAAGHDVTPGHDELHHYWTRGEGLAKWADSPRPWTTLVAHLVKHVGERKARIFASRWFIEVFGFAAGSDMNRVTHGKPPRGQVVGPG